MHCHASRIDRCFNEEGAKSGEIHFSHVHFEPFDVPGLHIADFMVRGRIRWDDHEDGRLPRWAMSQAA